jgi:hypothetical protein
LASARLGTSSIRDTIAGKNGRKYYALNFSLKGLTFKATKKWIWRIFDPYDPTHLFREQIKQLGLLFGIFAERILWMRRSKSY